jgi:DNA-binding protein Fis
MDDFSNIINSIDNMFYEDKEGKVYKLLLESLERPLFESVLRYTHGNKLKASRILGLNRNTLKSRLKKLGMAR